MLALPTDTRSTGERLFHHRRGVDEDLHIAAGLRCQPARQGLEPRLDDVVIVIAVGVDRHRATVALFEDRERIVGGGVIQSQHDDRAHRRPQRARIAAPVGGARHPIHVAMGALGKKALQPLRRLRDRIGPRDADHVKALRARGLCQRGFERVSSVWPRSER